MICLQQMRIDQLIHWSRRKYGYDGFDDFDDSDDFDDFGKLTFFFHRKKILNLIFFIIAVFYVRWTKTPSMRQRSSGKLSIPSFMSNLCTWHRPLSFPSKVCILLFGTGAKIGLINMLVSTYIVHLLCSRLLCSKKVCKHLNFDDLLFSERKVGSIVL